MDARGHEAERPREIPRAGWGEILRRVKAEVSGDNLSIIAAGVAFYAFLAVFPALVATVSIYGLVADPADVERQFQSLSGVIPPQAHGLIQGQLHQVVSNSGTALGVGALIGILVALWSAAKGTRALMEALNIAYEEEENRGFFRLNGTALLLTFAGILFVILALALVVVFPMVVNLLPLPGPVQALLSLGRWLLMVALLALWLAILYRYAPARQTPKFRWASWGALAATVLWLLGSIAFSIYVSNFGDYNKTYGSFGAIVILLLWIWVSAYAVLLGGELNSEIEHQTRADTTTGPERPLGERGAEMADREPPE